MGGCRHPGTVFTLRTVVTGDEVLAREGLHLVATETEDDLHRLVRGLLPG